MSARWPQDQLGAGKEENLVDLYTILLLIILYGL